MSERQIVLCWIGGVILAIVLIWFKVSRELAIAIVSILVVLWLFLQASWGPGP